MKLFDLIEQLENIYQKYGNLEVYKDNKEEDCNGAYPGFVSLTGEVFSKYDFDTFPEDYPEKDDFKNEDLCCII